MSVGNKTLCDLCNSKAYRKQQAKKHLEVDPAVEEDTEDSEADTLNDHNPGRFLDFECRSCSLAPLHDRPREIFDFCDIFNFYF